jgi:tRNA-dihydrouridine synthase A
MMAWTDRHGRYFMRLLSRNARLYTEMVPMNGLLKGDPARFLTFDAAEHPVALQLGGSDPEGLAQAAKIGADWGYDEINLNVGCPSDRVSSGQFGACLMAMPGLVADCVSAMAERVSVPITVKCRIGIDDMDIEEPLSRFVSGIHEAGCSTFVVHARKALLQGLSPAENRTIPPLNYSRVYRLKQQFPEITFVINGGIATLDDIKTHLSYVDGVMIGRAAFDTPYFLAGIDRALFGSHETDRSRIDIALQYRSYCEQEIAAGTSMHTLIRPILGLFKGCPGARAWRRTLSEKSSKHGATAALISEALEHVIEQRPAA